MASRGKRQQGQRRTRQRKTGTKRRSMFTGAFDLQGNPVTLIVIGVSVLLLAVVGFGVVQAVKGSGLASDFEFAVYQGYEQLGGSNVNFNNLLDDGRPVVLNFWAGDCPPCRAEMPAFQRIYEQYQDQVLFLGLDVGVFTGLGTRESALALLEELGITYPAGAPPDRKSVVGYSVLSMPTTIFFGADGEVFRRREGAIPENQMKALVAQLAEAG